MTSSPRSLERDPGGARLSESGTARRGAAGEPLDPPPHPLRRADRFSKAARSPAARRGDQAGAGSTDMTPSEYETRIRSERSKRTPRGQRRSAQSKSVPQSPMTSRRREPTLGTLGVRAPRSHAGSGLASARDRQRVRERNAAERSRVERMLATAPLPATGDGAPRPLSSTTARRPASLRPLPGRGCPVCSSSRTASDEVFQQGTLRLWECLHCEHRWTERPGRRWAELGASMARGAVAGNAMGKAMGNAPGAGPRIVRTA